MLKIGRSWVSPFTLWALGIKLQSSGLDIFVFTEPSSSHHSQEGSFYAACAWKVSWMGRCEEGDLLFADLDSFGL